MAVITEAVDAAVVNNWATDYGMNVGDTFEGSFGAGDAGDSVWVNSWSTANNYDIMVSGLDDPNASYTIQINDVINGANTVSVTIENGVVTSLTHNLNQILEVSPTGDGFIVTFNPAVNQSYGITIYNNDSVIDSNYTLTVGLEGTVLAPPPPPPPPAPLITEGADTVNGNFTDEVFDMLDGNDVVNGLGGNDTINGMNGDDQILGGDGQDLLNGNAGNDYIQGGNDNDTVYGSGGADALFGDAGNDHLDGGNEDDALQGGTGNDTMLGGKGNDILNGGADDDVLDGGIGDDNLTGGDGADTFTISANNGADYISDFTQGVDKIDVSALGIYDISQLTIADGGLSGTSAVIDLGNGNTVMVANVSTPLLTNSDFVLAENPFASSAGNDTIRGDDAANTLSGGDGDDRMFGFGGDDIMNGDAGRDDMRGGEGNDTMNGGDGNDKLQGQNGNDVLNGGARNDNLQGGAGDDILNGGTHNDRLDGGADNDVLNGESGHDKLLGGAGMDTLSGGSGRDQLTGGTEADVFVFETGTNHDTITDFENGLDLIDLTGLAGAGITQFTDLVITDDGVNATVALDANNTVTLFNTLATDLDASDFLF